MKAAVALLATLGLSIALAACGGGGQTSESSTGTVPATQPARSRSGPPPELRVSLDGYMGAENVGILMAEKRGFFADAGLDVWVGAPLKPRRPVRYVVGGTDEIAIAQQPQVAMAIANGAPIVAAGSVIAKPTAAMIWLGRSKMSAIADLRGKTIGVPGAPFQKELLRFTLAQAGLTLDDVEMKAVDYDLVPDLLDGSIDAAFGGTWNLEGVELETRGAKPFVTPVQEVEVPPYEELVVVARKQLLAEYPDAIHDFMLAVTRGNAAAVADPAAAIRTIEGSLEPNPETTPKTIRAQVEATLPLLSTDGQMSADGAEGLVEWMADEGMLAREFPAEEMLAGG